MLNKLIIISLVFIAGASVSGCQAFNNLFVFREEQKPLVTPPPAEVYLNKPQRLQPPLPLGVSGE